MKQILMLSIRDFYNHTEARVVTVPPTLSDSSTSAFCIVSNRSWQRGAVTQRLEARDCKAAVEWLQMFPLHSRLFESH